MSKNNSILDYENIVQDEYEVQHYGFSLKQFTEENFLFVENEIKSSIDDLKQKLCGTVKDINPELSDKINKITNEVCEDILKNAKEDTAKINNIISEKLKIPENVLLYADHAQAKMTTKEDIGDLQREIEALELTTTDNAFFIYALNNELNSYDQFEEVFLASTFSTTKAEEQLNTSLSTDIIHNYVNKIRGLESKDESSE